MANLASVTSKYPWEAVCMLADELNVRIYITKPKERNERAFVIMQMLMEWHKEYEYDESPKKVLARKFISINSHWEQKHEHTEKEDEEEEEPKFKRLARQLDMQGTVYDRKQMNEIEF